MGKMSAVRNHSSQTETSCWQQIVPLNRCRLSSTCLPSVRSEAESKSDPCCLKLYNLDLAMWHGKSFNYAMLNPVESGKHLSCLDLKYIG